jgi:heme exporter protein D
MGFGFFVWLVGFLLLLLLLLLLLFGLNFHTAVLHLRKSGYKIKQDRNMELKSAAQPKKGCC